MAGNPILDRPSERYGEGVALERQAAAAPMGEPEPAVDVAAGPAAGPAPPVRPASLADPTMRPDEPITAGIDYGPGPGAREPLFDDDPTLLLRAAFAAGPEAVLLGYLVDRAEED